MFILLTIPIILEAKATYTDHDRLFKELIQTFFKEFIQGFFPQVYPHINFSSTKFLEQEVFTDILKGEKRRIDILAEVKLNHIDQIILIHIEPQASYQKEFNERMFIYCSRLYEKYRKPILPIAIFSYNDKREVTDQFTMYTPTEKVLQFHYLQLHLINKNWRDFIQTDNPASAALLCKMGYSEKERVQVKLEFLRMLSRMELDPARMRLLNGFFETYLKLNEREENQMMDRVEKLPDKEKESVLRLPNSYFDKGKREGKQEGKQEVALKLVSKGMSITEIAEVTGLNRDVIKKIATNQKG